jgi:uncharacterized protein YbjT (DUF2867 family)
VNAFIFSRALMVRQAVEFRSSEKSVRILVLGANGFIGSAAVARLSSDGHDIIALGRRSGVPALGVTEQLRLDIAKTTDPAAWEPYLAGIDAVVNCAGVLQDAPGSSTSGVHEKGVSAGYEIAGGTVEEFAEFLREDIERYRRLTQAAGSAPE